MIAGIPLSIIVEAIVSVLLLATLGYCVILNRRLKRLHQDKDVLRTMITDLVSATTLAQRAVGELRTTASDCEFELGRRIEQATGMQDHLAKHVSAGQHVIDRLANITQAIGSPSAPVNAPINTPLNSLASSPLSSRLNAPVSASGIAPTRAPVAPIPAPIAPLAAAPAMIDPTPPPPPSLPVDTPVPTSSLAATASARQSEMEARMAARLDAMQDGGEKSTKEKLADLFAKLESQRSRGEAA